MPEPRVRLIPYATKERVAQASAARLLLQLGDRLSEDDTIHVSITGGSLGTGIWEAVRASPLVDTVDWTAVHIWWSDERFLPSGDADRNAQQSFEAFFAEGPVPAANIHVMGSSDAYSDQYEAARSYAEELSGFASPGHSCPRFAVSVLGMGPDGHMASLFPGKDEIQLTSEGVVGVENSPKPPPARVSMTRAMINHSDVVWFLVAGQDKAAALERVLEARDREADPETLALTPAAGARGLVETLYLVAEDALPTR